MTETADFPKPHRFEPLYDLDFLIYSSHKTGTQTLHRFGRKDDGQEGLAEPICEWFQQEISF